MPLCTDRKLAKSVTTMALQQSYHWTKNEANFNDFLLQLTVPSKRMHNGSQTIIFFVEMKRKRLNLLLMCIVITVVIQGL